MDEIAKVNQELKDFLKVSEYIQNKQIPPNIDQDAFYDLRFDEKLIDGIERLSGMKKDSILPTDPGNMTSEFINTAIPRIKDRQDLWDAASDLRGLATDIDAIFEMDPERRIEQNEQEKLAPLFKQLKKSLRYYEEVLEKYIKFLKEDLRPGPKNINYKGIKIRNEGGYKEAVIKKVIDNLDWLFSIFKKRGVEDLLLESLNVVELSDEEKEFSLERKDKSTKSAGTYYAVEKKITLRENALRGGIAKMLKRWLAEVFLHELGHHVHLSYITPEAKDFWEDGWSKVEEQKEKIEKELTITDKDREQYFKQLKRSGWDLQEASRKMDAVDRIKYLTIMYRAGFFTVPTQARISKRGKKLQDLLDDPQKRWAIVNYRKLEDRWEKEKRQKGTHGRRGDVPMWAYELSDLWSTFKGRRTNRKVEVSWLMKEHKEKPVEEALEALGIPTEYGKENVDEDFAETFVQFMVHPSKLSDIARWRMGRTLGMSGSGGKPVMRLSKLSSRVARRCLRYHLYYRPNGH